MSLADYSMTAVKAAMHPDATAQVSQFDELSSQNVDAAIVVSDANHHGDEYDQQQSGKIEDLLLQALLRRYSHHLRWFLAHASEGSGNPRVH